MPSIPHPASAYHHLRIGRRRRPHEVGFIKSSPQKIIADGTDWRFFNELKRELKG